MNTNYRDIVEERFKRLDRANNDLDYRLTVLEVCRRDPIRWINDWVWTYDPRNPSRGLPPTLPFILWPKQEEYILFRRECLVNKKFAIIGKSRDSGASWCACVDQLHHWLFEAQYKGAFGSRKEALVDKLGDPDALFSKLRQVLKNLPEWMKPKDFFSGYLRLINNENDSAITGEAGQQVGRGGRSTFYDLDEAAFLEQQQTVLAALSQNTDCLVMTSTPNGIGNEFYKIWASDSPGYRKFIFHWKEDERKNKWIHPDGRTGNGSTAPEGSIYPWYEDQKSKLSPIIIAQEIDINFTASATGVVIKHEWILAAINYPLVMHTSIRKAGLDVATEGKDRSVFTLMDGGNKVILIESWQGQNTTQSAHKTINLCRQHGVQFLFFDSVGVGAGVAATLQTIDQTQGLGFKYYGINGGSNPSDLFWPGENKTSREKFYNLRAELYYLLAQRFFKTWENVNGIANHPTDECISIPNDPNLIAQLSITTSKYTEGGKLLLTPKKELAVSPDYADSCVLANCPIPTQNWGTVKATW
jgi:phage terminase large subunit